MNTYNIDDYTEFSNAINTIQSSQDLVNENLLSVYDEITGLDNSEIFVGPICDNVMEEMDIISSQIKQDIFNLNSVTSFLQNAKENYQTSDLENFNSIGGI